MRWSVCGALDLYVDNKSAIDLAYNPEHHQKTKHIARRHFYVRELVEEAGFRADDLQINWSGPTYIPSGKYVYYQGQLSGHQPSATRALTEFKHVHIHDSLVDCSFCLERVISNLRGGGEPRRVGLLEGFVGATNATATRLPARGHGDASATAPSWARATGSG